MRLINATTLELEVFDTLSSRPPYAILSHRWIHGQEVTFEDMQRVHRQWMPGWSKIQFCCRQAHADGLDYAWVDTCCIDKSSSAELSEAINSMYTWYSDAVCCYAYLNDVCKSATNQSEIPALIVRSLWFTRAWTLQELIAPSNVVFYDSNFQSIGSKIDIAATIENAIKIPAVVLKNPKYSLAYPVAVRLSWAANRDASRLEDIAYSLFGLFEVNLPLLYGEGTRAFMRLQEEIIRQTHDHSIFSWSVNAAPKDMNYEYTPSHRLPLLASSPVNFKSCRDVVTLEEDEEIRPYTMTNVGLQIELQVFPYDLDTYVAVLDCGSSSTNHRYGILLTRESDKSSRWHRARVRGSDIVTISKADIMQRFVWQKMHIVKSPGRDVAWLGREEWLITDPDKDQAFYGLKINAPSFLMHGADVPRPYALVAHHDWEMPTTRARHDGEVFQSGHDSQIDIQPSLSLDVDFAFTPHQRPFLPGFPKATVLGKQDATAAVFVDMNDGVSKVGLVNSNDQSKKHVDLSVSAKSIGTLQMPLMTTGTAGVMFFDHVVHGIRSIKVGFDFDFHPVMILATHEADTDPQIQRWMQQRRYEPLQEFESTHYLLDDFHEEGTRQFWKLQPDILRTQKDHEVLDDGSVKLYKGVFAFTCRDKSSPSHWIFKPFEAQHWHIFLGLEKRIYDGTTYWEFTMDRRQDPLQLNFMLT